MDKYQERYLEHIENKLNRAQYKNIYDSNTKSAVLHVMENRRSIRRFTGLKLTQAVYDHIIEKAIMTAPSSCNRKGIYAEEVTPEYAEKVLVGGKNWVGRANKVFFLFGAKECYKNPIEVSYMPFLDAGFVGQNIYLLCELYGIGCCFINPNVREPIDTEDYFCGAVALGDYDA
jgi:nitroreductase